MMNAKKILLRFEFNELCTEDTDIRIQHGKAAWPN